jgi:FkbM family methyltransferase
MHGRIPAVVSHVYMCYRLLLDREPDEAGWAYWADRVASGVTLDNLIEEFKQSAEYSVVHRVDAVECVQCRDFVIYASRGDPIGQELIQTRRYEPNVTRALSSVLKPGMSLLDIGANIGYFTLLGAFIIGNTGRVIAIEPSPDKIKLLRLSIEANGFSNVSVLQCAASDGPGDLFIETGDRVGFVSRVQSQTSIRVRAIPLDDEIRDQRLDVIKIDIQGFEPRALRGLERTIMSQRPTIVTEFHPAGLRKLLGIQPEAYLSQLVTYGYSLAVIDHDGSLLPCSNIEDVMKFWQETNERAGMEGRLHLDLFCGYVSSMH